MCVLIYIFSKDTGHIGLGPTHMTSFYLKYFFKSPVSKQSHSEVLEVRTYTNEFCGDIIQSTAGHKAVLVGMNEQNLQENMEAMTQSSCWQGKTELT